MFDESDAIWRALSDPSRRTLLEELRAGPRTTSDLCRAFRTSRFAVMKHLDVLAEAGLVRVERRGRERWNHLQPSSLRPIGRWLDPYEGLASVQEARSRGSDWSPGID
jgi:DNA-binding transcriptional ArsR family regulator